MRLAVKPQFTWRSDLQRNQRQVRIQKSAHCMCWRSNRGPSAGQIIGHPVRKWSDPLPWQSDNRVYNKEAVRPPSLVVRP
jgi:hypothetical protein